MKVFVDCCRTAIDCRSETAAVCSGGTLLQPRKHAQDELVFENYSNVYMCLEAKGRPTEFEVC